ncbi:hypothetical protein GIB67_039382 [Kingdonia uniflora]|uniref:Uncharacterized protein n=1 Tax=Kingdonia uniflora TaxID=39325 RepID=A0A7J7NJH7_9MAGN|nr:hypothetical protein GIB67_039382 [Kingdonia uniflora]
MERCMADPGKGARDCLVSFLEEIDIDKVIDEATRLELGESITNLKHALLACRYTEEEREEIARSGGNYYTHYLICS